MVDNIGMTEITCRFTATNISVVLVKKSTFVSMKMIEDKQLCMDPCFHRTFLMKDVRNLAQVPQ